MRDLISRQAAIDALIRKMQSHDNGDGTMTICVMSEGLVKETLNDLPSAQPEWHEFPKNALYIRKADAIEICMEQIESPINTYFEKGTAEIIKEKITELQPAKPEEVIPHRNYKYFSDYWCKCGWHLGKKGDVKYCAECGRKVKWDG